MNKSTLLIIRSDIKAAEITAQKLKKQGYHVVDILDDYINLPNTESRLKTTLSITLSEKPNIWKEALKSDHFFVKDNHRYEKIRCSEILWMKAENSYVEIKTLAKNYLLTSNTLGSMLNKTQGAGLLRIHRSYAINLDRVEALEGNRVVIGQQYIPIGKNYLTEIKKHFFII